MKMSECIENWDLQTWLGIGMFGWEVEEDERMERE
jgi:hypothetical protein